MQAEEGPSSRLAAKLSPRRALVQPRAPPPFLSACFSQDVAPKTSGGRPPAARTWLTASSSLQLLLLHSQASPPRTKAMGGVQAPWARPAGQVLLPLLSCTQLGPHRLLLEHRNRMWSLQRESQEEGLPSGPAVAPRALFPFLNGVSLRSHLTFLSLSPNVLSCHLTQPFAPDTALFQGQR